MLAERADSAAAARRQPASKLTKEQLDEINTSIHQLNTPWATIFSVLERLTPASIALVSIEPDARHQSVRIQAEARTLDELMAYVQLMQDDGAIERVQLLDHETNERDGGRPMRLSFELILRAPSSAFRTAEP